MSGLLIQALVIARRDFTAIVWTPTFLIFLLAPLFMFAVATLGELGAARVIEGQQARALILAAPDELARLRSAERQVRAIVGADPGPPIVSLQERASVEDARKVLRRDDVSAIMYGPATGRTILHEPAGADAARYLAQVQAAATGTPARLEAVAAAAREPGLPERNATAFGAVFLMFLLSLVLASQAISTLAEERNNKVIEILAAAVPLEAVFLGKLLGLLGVALVFSAFWGAIAVAGALSTVGAAQLQALAPATGLPAFVALFLGYFTLAFLLLGAVFLGVGAQAGTMREIQMLSLPVTIFQVGMFALASSAAGAPDTPAGIFAAIFPFSSPFAMAARAATGVPAWQHAAAFAWQLVWLALTITIAARLFRRGVLNSGSGR
jgi:ABC-2 type transport system permease protein